MSLISADTIAAIATAAIPQQGSVSIVRLSGPQAVKIARDLFQAPGNQDWSSHRILYGHIVDQSTQQAVDEALLVLMLAPRSYTREDVVEFHCHGGVMAVQSVLQLCITAGARLAQPGEFTLRAFINGRIDLSQAESVKDLVSAQSAQASAIALAGLQGKLAQPIRTLRQTCLDILAEIEARIDFADDLPPLDESAIANQLTAVSQEVEKILSTRDRGALLRSGVKVAIVGRPNVGKSSLLNAWSRQDRAIVTDIPGTTRDVVESQLVVEGIPVQVIDTAGIRDTEDLVESIGVERSRKAAAAADLVILTINAAEGWTTGDQVIYDSICDRKVLLVINKTDLVAHPQIDYPAEIKQVVETVAAEGRGIDELEFAITKQVQTGSLVANDLEIALNQRQADVLTRAHTALQQVLTTLADGMPLDFWTIDLRGAIRALGEITGEDLTESVLERIFSRFCIGK
ncbi:MAG: tRNA uridine-5-carboxymethylaminomethyl(34) synthesis GTPase MnmE [Cyanobacteria bacterium P01_H01_bin.15]